ncbi:MAG: hypothetical protein IH618_15605 [Ignavibacteriaceae bacterium]|nr:hypothetical protein [Ignavibacteriaceae bacterium]
MKSNFIYIILLILLIAALSGASLNEEKTDLISISYFPVNQDAELVYESSFGETVTKYFQDGEFTISSSEADDFKYRQALIIEEDGVYVIETYQFVKIFLFINKEATSSYGKPLLRFPLPLLPEKSWEWEGDEYSDGDTNTVKVTGKVIGKEIVETDAGRFEAVKLESLVEGSSDLKNRVTEWYAEGIGLIKAKVIIEGGGVMGFARDILGYGTIEFELKEIRNQ